MHKSYVFTVYPNTCKSHQQKRTNTTAKTTTTNTKKNNNRRWVQEHATITIVKATLKLHFGEQSFRKCVHKHKHQAPSERNKTSERKKTLRKKLQQMHSKGWFTYAKIRTERFRTRIHNKCSDGNKSLTHLCTQSYRAHTHTHNQKLVITQLIYLPRLLVLIKRVSVF